MSIYHSVHGCKGITLDVPYNLKRPNGEPFVVRSLTITDDSGGELCITLYGDTTDDVSTADERERYAQPAPDPLAEIVAEADAQQCKVCETPIRADGGCYCATDSRAPGGVDLEALAAAAPRLCRGIYCTSEAEEGSDVCKSHAAVYSRGPVDGGR